MPIVHRRLRCGAPNAFRLRSAIWQLFLDHPPQLQNQAWRSFVSTPTARPTANSHDPAQSVGGPEIKGSTYSGQDGLRIRGFQAHPPKHVDNDKPRWWHKRRPKALDIKEPGAKKLIVSLERLRQSNRESLIRDVAASDTRTEAQTWRPDVVGQQLVATKRASQSLVEKSKSGRKGELASPVNTLHPLSKKLQNWTTGKESVIRTVEHRTSVLKPPSTTGHVLEYEGKYVLPMSKSKTPPEKYPWMKGQEHITGGVRLENEIRLFAEYIRPTRFEIAARDAAIQQTRDIIHELLPEHNTEIFGSQRTGINLATSDIDVRIWIANSPSQKGTLPGMAPRHQLRKELQRYLRIIHAELDAHPDYHLCQLRNARYPLISVQHKASGYDFQIVCNNDTSHTRELVRTYTNRHPHLYPIFSLLKTALDIRGLSDVYRGGLGSYSLFMMVVAGIHKVSPTDHNMRLKYLGYLFRQILDFFVTLDTYKYGISVDPYKKFPKLPLDVALAKRAQALERENLQMAGRYHIGVIDPTQPYLFCLQDPADHKNDLGRKGFGYKHIIATLSHLYSSLTDPHSFGAPQDGKLTSCLDEMIGPCFDAYKGRRAMAEEFGRRALEQGLVGETGEDILGPRGPPPLEVPNVVSFGQSDDGVDKSSAGQVHELSEEPYAEDPDEREADLSAGLYDELSSQYSDELATVEEAEHFDEEMDEEMDEESLKEERWDSSDEPPSNPSPEEHNAQVTEELIQAADVLPEADASSEPREASV